MHQTDSFSFGNFPVLAVWLSIFSIGSNAIDISQLDAVVQLFVHLTQGLAAGVAVGLGIRSLRKK